MRRGLHGVVGRAGTAFAKQFTYNKNVCVRLCVCVKPPLGALTSSHMDAYAGHLEWELGWEAKRSEDLQVPFPRAESPSPGHRPQQWL